jgi:hypothetical protein
MDNPIIHSDDWVDVIHKKDEYIDCFDIPTETALENLSTNDMVKISNGFERFFVRVKYINGSTVVGIVDNHLVGKYDYDFNDTVRFEKKNIFVIKKDDTPTNDIKKTKNKNARRMLKILGIDPKQQSKEAMALLSIMDKNT